eukprot:GSMAST32.ASY1.ANO1.683.1 assembled CDS
MECYWSLSIHFHTQADPAFCGLGALVTVLNALAVDPMKQWKGVWRFYDETMLDCCRPLKEIKKKGLSSKKLLCLAKCNGCDVQWFDASNSTVNTFRDLQNNDTGDVTTTSTSSTQSIMIISYCRKILGQTGGGHFSPIAGYDAETDRVLILDVARFKYVCLYHNFSFYVFFSMFFFRR